ncbi:MAG: phosphoglycerate kinase, partial [Candidatus Pacebacteria bacterium]|nr:phosphoglycerate kinase [Candidatus Paceibacterota bacterium]
MKFLTEGDFKNKKVLVRCDFNVALDAEGRIVEEFRIEKTLPTIRFLIKKEAAVILMSHLEKDGKATSLQAVAKRLERMLLKRIKFIGDCAGEKAAKEVGSLKPGQVAMLENLRFHPGEKSGSDVLAKSLAALGDCYVNEAFSCSHREHASITGVPKYLPSFAGMQLQLELETLSRVLEKPIHPLVVVIGGSKAETKAKVISNISKVADHILIGSKIGERILAQKQQLMGRETGRKEASIDLIDLTSPKIHLPIDGVMALKDNSEGYMRTAAMGMMRSEEDVCDIGPETTRFFTDIIKDARTILFNGPMGLFEEPQFAAGTKAIVEAISRTHQAYRVAGGGETLEAIRKYKAEKTFNFLS